MYALKLAFAILLSIYFSEVVTIFSQFLSVAVLFYGQTLRLMPLVHNLNAHKGIRFIFSVAEVGISFTSYCFLLDDSKNVQTDACPCSFLFCFFLPLSLTVEPYFLEG